MSGNIVPNFRVSLGGGGGGKLSSASAKMKHFSLRFSSIKLACVPQARQVDGQKSAKFERNVAAVVVVVIVDFVECLGCREFFRE